MPLCIKTSGGWLCPVAAVWGLEEETHTLLKLVDMCRAHCEDHGVDCIVFTRRIGSAEVVQLLVCVCVYTLVIIAQELEPCDSDQDEAVKSMYRTYQYHPKWEKFFVAAMDGTTPDDVVLSLIPSIPFQPTLHCDSGTAFISLTKHLYWRRTSCAKHMEPSVASLNHTLKDQAMSLLYGRNISTTMAFEIRDSLTAACIGCTNLGAPTRKWVQANFGTDETMHVCTHPTLVYYFSHSCCRSTHKRFEISFFHLVMQPILPWNSGFAMPKVTKKTNPILEGE